MTERLRIGWHRLENWLPDVARLADDAGRYDLILCSALLMLVPPAELTPSVVSMARLLAPAGRIGVDVRQPMPGEPSALFFAHSDEEIHAAAAAAGLVCLERAEVGNALEREPYRWRSFMFE